METFLGAEIMFNLFTVVKDCSSKDEGIRLQVKSHSVFRQRLYLFISNELSGEHLTCYLFSFFFYRLGVLLPLFVIDIYFMIAIFTT